MPQLENLTPAKQQIFFDCLKSGNEALILGFLVRNCNSPAERIQLINSIFTLENAQINGRTPLIFATLHLDERLVKMLVRLGADKGKAGTHDGHFTPAGLAERHSDEGAAAFDSLKQDGVDIAEAVKPISFYFDHGYSIELVGNINDDIILNAKNIEGTQQTTLLNKLEMHRTVWLSANTEPARKAIINRDMDVLYPNRPRNPVQPGVTRPKNPTPAQQQQAALAAAAAERRRRELAEQGQQDIPLPREEPEQSSTINLGSLSGVPSNISQQDSAAQSQASSSSSSSELSGSDGFTESDLSETQPSHTAESSINDPFLSPAQIAAMRESEAQRQERLRKQRSERTSSSQSQQDDDDAGSLIVHHRPAQQPTPISQPEKKSTSRSESESYGDFPSSIPTIEELARMAKELSESNQPTPQPAQNQPRPISQRLQAISPRKPEPRVVIAMPKFSHSSVENSRNQQEANFKKTCNALAEPDITPKMIKDIYEETIRPCLLYADAEGNSLLHYVVASHQLSTEIKRGFIAMYDEVNPAMLTTKNRFGRSPLQCALLSESELSADTRDIKNSVIPDFAKTQTFEVQCAMQTREFGEIPANSVFADMVQWLPQRKGPIDKNDAETTKKLKGYHEFFRTVVADPITNKNRNLHLATVNGVDPLLALLQKGHYKDSFELIQESGKIPQTFSLPDTEGRTVLHKLFSSTAQAGKNSDEICASTLRSLARSSIPIDQQDINGQTALHLAASMGYKACVKQLLAMGAKKDIADVNGKEALHLAKDNIEKNPAEYKAIVRRLSKDVVLSVEDSVNPETKEKFKDTRSLYKFISQHYFEAAATILDSYTADTMPNLQNALEAFDDNGYTFDGKSWFTDMSLEDLVNENSDNILHFALKASFSKVIVSDTRTKFENGVKDLIAFYIKRNPESLVQPNKDGLIPLQVSLKNGSSYAVEALIGNSVSPAIVKKQLNYKNSEKKSNVLFDCIENTTIGKDILDKYFPLFSAGMFFDSEQDDKSFSAVQKMIAHGRFDLLEKLVSTEQFTSKYKKLVTSLDKDGFSPVHHAFLQIADEQNPEKFRDEEHIFAALNSLFPKNSSKELQAEAFSLPDASGRTPLMLAVASGNRQLADRIMFGGADVLDSFNRSLNGFPFPGSEGNQRDILELTEKLDKELERDISKRMARQVHGNLSRALNNALAAQGTEKLTEQYTKDIEAIKRILLFQPEWAPHDNIPRGPQVMNLKDKTGKNTLAEKLMKAPGLSAKQKGTFFLKMVEFGLWPHIKVDGVKLMDKADKEKWNSNRTPVTSMVDEVREKGLLNLNLAEKQQELEERKKLTGQKTLDDSPTIPQPPIILIPAPPAPEKPKQKAPKPVTPVEKTEEELLNEKAKKILEKVFGELLSESMDDQNIETEKASDLVPSIIEQMKYQEETPIESKSDLGLYYSRLKQSIYSFTKLTDNKNIDEETLTKAAIESLKSNHFTPVSNTKVLMKFSFEIKELKNPNFSVNFHRIFIQKAKDFLKDPNRVDDLSETERNIGKIFSKIASKANDLNLDSRLLSSDETKKSQSQRKQLADLIKSISKENRLNLITLSEERIESIADSIASMKVTFLTPQKSKSKSSDGSSSSSSDKDKKKQNRLSRKFSKQDIQTQSPEKGKIVSIIKAIDSVEGKVLFEVIPPIEKMDAIIKKAVDIDPLARLDSLNQKFKEEENNYKLIVSGKLKDESIIELKKTAQETLLPLVKNGFFIGEEAQKIKDLFGKKNFDSTLTAEIESYLLEVQNRNMFDAFDGLFKEANKVATEVADNPELSGKLEKVIDILVKKYQADEAPIREISRVTLYHNCLGKEGSRKNVSAWLSEVKKSWHVQGKIPGTQKNYKSIHLYNLKNINLNGIILTGRNLTKSDFSGSSLIKADLTNAYLNTATFNGTNLTDADLTGADLTGASFEKCICVGAKFKNTEMAGVSIQKSNLKNADFEGRRCKDGTLLTIDQDSRKTLPPTLQNVIDTDVGVGTLQRPKNKGHEIKAEDSSESTSVGMTESLSEHKHKKHSDRHKKKDVHISRSRSVTESEQDGSESERSTTISHILDPERKRSGGRSPRH